MLFVTGAVGVIWLLYFASFARVVLRLRGGVPSEEHYKPTFSELVPVPHGNAAERYTRRFPHSRALRTTGILYAVAMYGVIAFVVLHLLSWIVS
jgi:hypothetical protein